MGITPNKRDREICGILETNPSELEKLLDLSRQTIAKRISENEFFGVDEVVEVASKKFPDEAKRSALVSQILKDYFPDVLRFGRDWDVARFSTYCVFGMYIQPEIDTNPVFRRFVSDLLSDEEKFVLFVCLPQKEYVQLNRWLDNFKREKQNQTASYVALPCKLVELAPIQVLADFWSSQPKLIQFNRDEVFVDELNSVRASQLANALIEYGLSQENCSSIENPEVRGKLLETLNHSFLDTDENKLEIHFNMRPVIPTEMTEG